MARMCDGICSDCNCGANNVNHNTKDKITISKETAYRVLKSIAEGAGSNPRIYAQNTIDSIVYSDSTAYRVLKSIAEGAGSDPRIYAQNTIYNIDS